MRALLFSLATFAVLAAAPVGAQESDYSTKETRVLMHAYAKCVVGRRPAKASEAIVRNVDNGTILRDYQSLVVGECLARQVLETTMMRFGGDLYRYALADALVNRELPNAPAPDLAAVQQLDHRDPGPVPQQIAANGKKLSRRAYEAAVKGHERSAAFSFLSRYGECVVRSNAAGAKALLLTRPDSAEETAQFGALRPALASCLPEGEMLKFGRTTLRGTVAINYYRLVQAARAAETKAAS
ncbi:MAG TPA: hypothetical protein VGB59_02430 [Allosphingosinicella sp.]|jgi:hypothetical protein